MHYGRTFLCHNRGPFYMREIVGSEQPAYADARLAEAYAPSYLIKRGWAKDSLISPDAEPSEV